MAESFVGKSGVDAAAKALHHICRLLVSYEDKMRTAIANAEADGHITDSQRTIALNFIAVASATCAVFEAVAAVSGF
jgi:hypothetical protein